MKFRHLLTVMFVTMLAASQLTAQTRPVEGLHKNTPNVHALTNVKVVVVPGKVIENATVIVRDSYIDAVGPNVKVPADAVVHDMNGKTVYAGFIDLYTNYGIAAPASGRTPAGGRGGGQQASAPASGSSNNAAVYWNQFVRPERRAADLFKHNDKSAKTFRENGFTTVLTFSNQGLFRGTGALVLLKDGEKNETILVDEAALGMSMTKGGGRRSFRRDLSNYPSSLMGVVALQRQVFYDADWYQKSWSGYSASPGGKTAPEVNLSLQALQPYLSEQKTIIMETDNEFNALRAAKVQKEFGLNMWVRTGGHSYRWLDDVKKTGMKIIVPLNYPETPKVATIEDEVDVSLRDLRHWDMAAENAGRIEKAGIEFALTSSLLKKQGDFLKNLRTAVERGLSTDRALAALTTAPAAWLDMTSSLGSVERGKLANLIVTDGDIFNSDTKIHDAWVGGKRFEITTTPEVDLRGDWTLTLNSGASADTGMVMLTGTDAKPSAALRVDGKKISGAKFNANGRQVTLSFSGDSLGQKGMIRLSGMVEGKAILGNGAWPNGETFKWRADFANEMKKKRERKKKKAASMSTLSLVYPEGAYGIASQPEQPAAVLVKNATIWTSGPDGIIENADLLVRDGKVESVGKNLSAPGNAVEIDATGKHVTPGIIDAHSHSAAASINEGIQSISSEVRMEDVIESSSIHIYRQLAGGVTATQLLHGSANPIGGQSAILKFRWGSSPEGLLFEGSFPSIKFALGENVKRNTIRYPNTRMGVEQFFSDRFQAAKDYRTAWDTYRANSKKDKNLAPPRRNLQLEPLVEILEDKRIIHCHSYRQDEILALLRVADDQGFKVWTFTHILEGYKVADEMRKHGAMASTFSDWWVYKFEVYDAIPYNGTLMHDQEVVVSFNSDSGELARRLNTEASKAVKYGGVDPAEALKFVTLNPAKQLRIEHRVGSLEKGKDADFVIWSGDPLSTYTICEQTWIDGKRYFSLEEDAKLRQKAEQERAMLVQKVLNAGEKKGPAAGGRRARPTDGLQ